MKFYSMFLTLAGAALTLAACSSAPDGQVVTVDVGQKGAEVNPKMYGIFFEEINHSGDGGLYAELVRNRNFEEQVIPSGTTYVDGYAVGPHKPDYNTGRYNNWKIRWDIDSLKMIGWNVKGDAAYDVVSENSLHPNTPNAMRLEMKAAGVILENEGYWGMPFKGGDKYDLRFYVNAANYKGGIKARIVSKGSTLAETSFTVKGSGWQEYTAQMTSGGSASDGALQLEFDAPGKVYVDYVSLFPQNTYKGHKNGMRADVAQLLEDLKPGFIRWPGGCIAEGATYENRVKWKETLGDPMTRKSEWDLWNYHCTWGFGYHEFLQLCEDFGADPMFVANVGMSCTGRNGDFVEDLTQTIQDIEDAIEYAQGDVSTEWGAKRAAAGHPAPFKIKYIELGNEQVGTYYAERYNYLYGVLKPKYPEITFICTLGLDNTRNSLDKADMLDPHYYVDPTYFYENATLFDNEKRGVSELYVGEYAVNSGVGPGNMDGALAEAAFISGMERNGDLVKIASYAPLIENSNHRDWPTNLIWVNSEKALGRTSYYVQQMYSQNVPTYNVGTKLETVNESLFNGFVGLGGDNLSGQYRNFKVTDASGKVVYETEDFSGFSTVDNSAQTGRRMFNQTMNMLKGVNVTTGTVEFEACTSAQPVPAAMKRYLPDVETINVLPSLAFGSDADCKNYLSLNLGGSMGVPSAISLLRTMNGATSFPRSITGEPFSMEPGKWYKFRVEFRSDNVLDLYVDGNKVYSSEVLPVKKIHTVAGYDQKTGETIIKFVNGTDKPYTTKLVINAVSVSKNGTVITLKADSAADENSFEQPTKISPVTTSYDKFGEKFTYTFEPESFTILRIPSSAE